MIRRSALLHAVRDALRRAPIAAILGPRQCGKTTIARQVAKGRKADYFDLEDATDRATLASPKAPLELGKDLVVIDEIQTRPELFETLRVLVDRPGFRRRFLILGSASPHIVRGISETLAGRVAHVDMGGFDIAEVGAGRFRDLWFRGGMPRSFLAASDADSFRWRRDYIRNLLARDIPQLGVTIPAETLRRFWSMVAHFHGQIWSSAEFARSLGSSEPTARRYLDLLTGAFVVRQLQPWFENISKRQHKSPKVYVRDSGLLHCLLEIPSMEALYGHYKYGASWEGFAVEQVMSLLGLRDAFYWGTQAGAELDLLVFVGGKRIGFEMKCADAPSMTRSLHVALEDLKLERVFVVYPGARSYSIHERVEVVSILELKKVIRPLGGPTSSPTSAG